MTPDGQRIAPQMGAAAYKSFIVASPLDRCYRRRRARCEEILCPAYVHGWVSVVDETTPLGEWRAGYIRRESGRTFTEERADLERAAVLGCQPGMTVFTFPAGQPCFDTLGDTHVVAERIEDAPQLYVVRDGDWRGNPTGNVRQHANGADWSEDMGEHLIRLNEQIDRG